MGMTPPVIGATPSPASAGKSGSLSAAQAQALGMTPPSIVGGAASQNTPIGGNGDAISRAANIVSSIFPGKQIGTAVGNSLYGLGTAADDAVHGNFGAAGNDIMQAGKENSNMVVPVAADAAQAVMLPATMAFGGAGGALADSSGFLPAAGRVAANAATGAAFGATGGLANGQSGAQLGESTALGGLFAGGLSTAGELGSALIDNFASQSGESRLTDQKNGLIKLTNSFNENSTPSTNPIQTLQQNGFIQKLQVANGRVNVDGLTNAARTGAIDQAVDGIQQQATQLINQMPGGVDTEQFKSDVLAAVKANPAIRDAGNVSRATAEVDRRFSDYASSFGDSMPFKIVNGIKVAMNKVWNPEEVDVARTVGDVARSYLYDGAGQGEGVVQKTGANTALQTLMKNEGELIKARNFAESLGGTIVKGGRLAKYFADTIGAGVGGAVGGAVGSLFGSGGTALGITGGAALGGKAGDMAATTAQTNYFHPLLAGGAQAFQSFLQGPGQGIANTTKASLSRLAPSLVGSPPQQ